MPCLSGKLVHTVGPIVQIGIAQAGTITHPAQQPPSVKTFSALIDTGAGMTCISPNVATAVGLTPLGKRPMLSATQAVPMNIYMIDVALPFGKLSYLMNGMQVMEFNCQQGTPFEVLLGRDVLCQGTFNMSFDGHFTFCL